MNSLRNHLDGGFIVCTYDGVEITARDGSGLTKQMAESILDHIEQMEQSRTLPRSSCGGVSPVPALGAGGILNMAHRTGPGLERRANDQGHPSLLTAGSGSRPPNTGGRGLEDVASRMT